MTAEHRGALPATGSVLPADEAPAHPTTVFLDTENVFFWSESERTLRTRSLPPKRAASLDRLHSSAFGLPASADETVRHRDLQTLAGRVLTDLTTWVTREHGSHELRSYGKSGDGGVRAVRPLVERGAGVHVGVSSAPDAADVALVKDLEERSRRPVPQVFVIGSSDLKRVLAWSDLVAASAPHHTYLVLLGPTLVEELGFRRLRYAGSISELYGREVMRRKGKPVASRGLNPDDGDLRERYHRSQFPPEALRSRLERVPPTRFGDELTGCANAVGEVPAQYAERALATTVAWPQVCLDAWRVAHPADPPFYATPGEIERLFATCRNHVAADVLLQTIGTAITTLPSEEGDARTVALWDAYLRKLTDLGAAGTGHL